VARHEGRAVFVPFALPGERVRAELTETRKNYARARLVEVLAAAPERRDPLCPHHFHLRPPEGFDSGRQETACGGCQLQHLDYAAQLTFKQQTVANQLRRLGRVENPPVRPTLASPQPYYYRNNVQFALREDGRLGFRAAGSRQVVAIRECHQIEPALGELFPQIQVEPEQARELERLGLRAGAEDERLVVLEAAAEAPEVELDLPVSAALLRPDGSSLALAGDDHLVMSVRGRDYRVSAGSFFQVNTGLTERLVDLVLEGWRWPRARRCWTCTAGSACSRPFSRRRRAGWWGWRRSSRPWTTRR
jgi:23S rRNA (uracil1939-C5)-methyltransferase